uniref:Uncharacterized protein n=1 Tax=Tanacetum cinerariifolium TaxID=118510 RepID=A0A6L2JTM8_TANCI|nr:hypothetical protein [Tanacetum cinerariifolium]
MKGACGRAYAIDGGIWCGDGDDDVIGGCDDGVVLARQVEMMAAGGQLVMEMVASMRWSCGGDDDDDGIA